LPSRSSLLSAESPKKGASSSEPSLESLYGCGGADAREEIVTGDVASGDVDEFATEGELEELDGLDLR
jgi:hypothetical protein